jgi:CheY-like chemotaxis protein
MNLVVNARDAMPEGGRLTIQTENTVFDAEYAAVHEDVTPGQYVMLAVSDSGTGMDEPTRARIFEPFFTTKGLSGTGLGLSTIYGIVKQSGGSIFVYSEPGEGTTFKIYFPRRLSRSIRVTRAPPSATHSAAVETILVVEDDEAVRGVARRILHGAGYTVLTASNGSDALRLCEEHSEEIHLVLTDVVMPLMGGKVLAERLASVRPGVKVLYMSGFTNDTIVHHGVLDPDTYFIGKPLTQVELLQKVRDVLDESPMVTSR